MTTIELKLVKMGWVGRWSDMFNEGWIPLPFTALASKAMVLNRLKQTNPSSKFIFI